MPRIAEVSKREEAKAGRFRELLKQVKKALFTANGKRKS